MEKSLHSIDLCLRNRQQWSGSDLHILTHRVSDHFLTAQDARKLIVCTCRRIACRSTAEKGAPVNVEHKQLKSIASREQVRRKLRTVC